MGDHVVPGHAPAKGRLGTGPIVVVADIVSIHAPAKGRRTSRSPAHDRIYGFNPRPREGATGRVRASVDGTACFNPRPREGATQAVSSNGTTSEKFQSTPPRRGDAMTVRLQRDAVASFNPRPREGATTIAHQIKQSEDLVSIHAPAKGRRGLHRLGQSNDSVSIHAPAKGRRRTASVSSRVAGFQSTPPRRGDTRGRPVGAWPASVSIHAPAKGRPTIGDRCSSVRDSFNPRPREGATGCGSTACGNMIVFQSTPPRRGDWRRPDDWYLEYEVSIHAPAKGRRTSLGDPRRLHAKFQSTPPRRGDLIALVHA